MRIRDPKTKQVLTKFSAQWGKSCENDKKVQIKSRVEKSREQMREEKEMNTTDYWKCEEDKREGKMYSKVCMELIKKRSELHKVDIEITHQGIPKWMKTFYSQSMMYAQRYMWNNLEFDNVEIRNPSNKIYITAELDKNFREANVTINHPFENIKFEKLGMPMKMQPMSVRKTIVQQWMDVLMNNQFTPYCKVRGDEIRTFDDVSYEYKLSKCEHILAKDCSPEKKFTVLTSKKQDSNKKITKVFIGDKKVELIPNEDRDELMIRINGEQKDVKINEKMIVRKNMETEFVSMDAKQPRNIHQVYMFEEQDRREECEELRRRKTESLDSRARQMLRMCDSSEGSWSDSRSDSREDRFVSREECRQLSERKMTDEYMSQEDREKLDTCENSRSDESTEYRRDYESRSVEVTPRKCEELQGRNGRNEYLNFHSLVSLYQCKERKRMVCHELRRRQERNEEFTELENDMVRECQRMRTECNELERRDQNNAYLTTEEVTTLFGCRDQKRSECKYLRTQVENSEEVTAQETETMRECERKQRECNQLNRFDENEMTEDEKKTFHACPEKKISREECEELRERKERNLYLSTDETEKCHKCEREMIRRMTEGMDFSSRTECQELLRKKEQNQYMTSQESEKSRRCERHERWVIDMHVEFVSRSECQEIRRKMDWGEYMTSQESEKSRKCEMQERWESDMRGEFVSRSECQDIRRKVEQGEYLTNEENVKFHKCMRQEDFVSRSECQEIRRKMDQGESMTTQESEKNRKCSECEEIRRKMEEGDFLTNQESEKNRKCEREEDFVSRSECQEMRRKMEQEEYMTNEESEKSRKCERQERWGSDKRDDFVSRSECQEMRRKMEQEEYMTNEESEKSRKCERQERRNSYDSAEMLERSECQEIRRREVFETITREERDRLETQCRRFEGKIQSVEVTSMEEKYWDNFESRFHSMRSEGERREMERREEDEERNPIEIIIIRHRDQRVEIICRRVGLKVKSDGKNIKVELSNFYRNKQCGLCGNMDGERTSEFVGPMKEIYEKSQQFGLSYQVPSEKCSADATCLPRMKNVVMEKTIDGMRKTCFSKSSVSQCNERCRKMKTTNQELQFHCLETSIQSTQDLIERSNSEVINKFSKKRSDFAEMVEVHDECTRN
jgi:hypothetical protein